MLKNKYIEGLSVYADTIIIVNHNRLNSSQRNFEQPGLYSAEENPLGLVEKFGNCRKRRKENRKL